MCHFCLLQNDILPIKFHLWWLCLWLYKFFFPLKVRWHCSHFISLFSWTTFSCILSCCWFEIFYPHFCQCPEKLPEIWDYCNTALPCEPGVDIILRNHSNIKWIFSSGDWKSVFWSWLTLSWVLTRQLLPCGTPVVCIWSCLTCSSKSNINWIFSHGDWKSIFWSLWTLSWVLCRLLLWVQYL